MNARQKAKKLKKELAEVKADKANGGKWLRIDEFYYEPTEDFFYEKPLLMQRETFNVRIGKTILQGVIAWDDEIHIIDSDKLDNVHKNAMKMREVQDE